MGQNKTCTIVFQSALLAHHRDKDPGAAWRRRVHDMWPIIWAAWLGAFAVAVVFGLFG